MRISDWSSDVCSSDLCPDLKVRVETGNDHADLVRDGIDVAIRYGPGGYTGVCAERLMDAPVFPVCAPSPTGDGLPPPTTPDDLRHPTLRSEERRAGKACVSKGRSRWSTES